MFKIMIRVAVAAVIGALVAAPLAAAPAGPLETQSFPIGNKGDVCEAQGVRLGDARQSVFDRKWALICRDVDQPVGAAYSVRSGDDAQALVSKSRGTPLDCAAPGGTPEAMPGVLMRRCRDPQSGLEWTRYIANSGEWTHVVEGLTAYDSALRLALSSLVEDRVVPGEVAVVTTGGTGSMAEARASLGDSALLIGQGYRQNNAGDYVQAEEYFRPDLLDTTKTDNSPQAAAVMAARRHELLVNRALQLSNLGRYAEASKAFAQAGAMGVRDPVQARLSRNFEAVDAINRGQLAEASAILARPVPPIAAPVQVNGEVAIDPTLAAGLNAGLSTGLTDSLNQETRLTTVERAAIIDAQARQLTGTVLRLSGKPQEALPQLAAARDQVLQVKEGRVLSATRLLSQIYSEMALANEALGHDAEAEGLLRQAVTMTEERYPDSAAVNETRGRLAAYLSRRGKDDEALQLYRGIVADTAGRRDALVGLEHQMEPYFQMLVDRLPQNPALVSDLFSAAQLVERPGVAQTLSQLTRRLAAGNSEASDLFRRATNVEREINQTNVAMAQLRIRPGGPPADQMAELEDRQTRLRQSQLELVNALSAYPAYRSLAHNYVTADDLRALLKPGEAYAKLVKVGDAMFMVYLSPTRSAGWKVGASAAEVTDLVARLRDSISVTIGGVTATYPFDVDSSRKLFVDLFAPVAGDLTGLKHLVFEPDGALMQLPINLLITDQAGVDAYNKRVDAGGDEFDFRGIAWLGRNTAISTALSPASFRDMRNAAPSMAKREYLGLGQNQPVGNLTRAALVRGVPESNDPGCDIPLAAWNRPIPDDELKLASRVFGPANATLMTGAAFTDTAIQRDSDLDNYKIVHFATHGLVAAPQAGCPARPALLTSFGSQGSDGLLEFGEIFGLKLDADLVILSACNTASQASFEAMQEAGIEGGGGQALDGLVRAFIGAGGRQVIASHWPAPEEFDATKRLFESLFESPPGESLGLALENAERKLMDDPATSHPFYWSGFALIGDGERPLIAAK